MRVLIAIFCILLAGCATITKGKYQEIKINSNVSGALVELDGVKLGYTPFTGKVKRGSVGKIKVSKTGYSAGTIQMQNKRDNLGNITWGAPSTLGGLSVGGYLGVKTAESYKGSSGGGELGKMSDASSSTTYPLLNIVIGAALGASVGIVAGAGPTAIGSTIDDITSAGWEYSPSQYYVELKQIGRSGLDFINDVAIRHFATVNHSQIAIDAGKNDGEYVNALAGLMRAKTDEEVAKLSINEALEKSKGDQVLFGDALIDRFRR